MSITLKMHFVGLHLFVREPEGNAWTVVMPKLAMPGHAGHGAAHRTMTMDGPPPRRDFVAWPPLHAVDGGLFEFRSTGGQAAWPESLADLTAATGRKAPRSLWHTPENAANRRVSVRLVGGQLSVASPLNEYAIGGVNVRLATDILWTGTGLADDALQSAALPGSAAPFPTSPVAGGVVELSVLSLPPEDFNDPTGISRVPAPGTRVEHLEQLEAALGVDPVVPVVFTGDFDQEFMGVTPWMCVAGGALGDN